MSMTTSVVVAEDATNTGPPSPASWPATAVLPGAATHGSADLRRLVRRGEPRAVRAPPGAPGAVRPVDGGERQEALHRGAAAVHPGELLPLLRAGGADRAQPGGKRAAPQGRLRVAHPRPRPQRTGRLPRPGRPRLGPRPCPGLAAGPNGLRISEALGADIDDLEYQRGHRTLKILRRGGKRAVIPLAPRTSRPLDLYIDERTTGPIFVGASGARMTATRPTAWSSAWPAGRG